MARPVRRQTILVDPSFFIPEGAEDAYYDDTIILADESFEDVDIEFDDTDDEAESGLDFPKDISILSQQIVRGPGGQQYVEVTFEFTPVTGATNYEIKIALDETS